MDVKVFPDIIFHFIQLTFLEWFPEAIDFINLTRISSFLMMSIELRVYALVLLVSPLSVADWLRP